MGGDNLLRNKQSQTQPRDNGRGANPFELLKNALLILFTDPDTAILNLNQRLPVLIVHAYVDRALDAIT